MPYPDLDPVMPPSLAAHEVHYVGEPVAVGVARNRFLTEDLADRVRVRFRKLPAVTDAWSPRWTTGCPLPMSFPNSRGGTSRRHSIPTRKDFKGWGVECNAPRPTLCESRRNRRPGPGSDVDVLYGGVGVGTANDDGMPKIPAHHLGNVPTCPRRVLGPRTAVSKFPPTVSPA